MNTFSSSSSKNQHAHFHLNTPVFFEEMKKPYFAKFCIISYFLSVLFLFCLLLLLTQKYKFMEFIHQTWYYYFSSFRTSLFIMQEQKKRILRLNFHFLLLANGLLMFLAARTQQKVLFLKRKEKK